MIEKHWSFSPVDTWFFRESRPYDSIGGTQLNSLFPPSARTVAGAVRSLIGEQVDVNWKAFEKGDGTQHRLSPINLCEQIGDANQLGQLRLVGPYLLYDKQRLYPVPLIVLDGTIRDKKAPYQQQSVRLRPGEPVECDLGKVKLPKLAPLSSQSKTIENAKPIENAWLTAEDLGYVLAGDIPHSTMSQSKLFDIEPRVGIALDRQKRTVKEGMLYQNQHIRVRHYLDLQIGLTVGGIEKALHPTQTGLVRFGGEGRLAEVTVSDSLPATLPHPEKLNNTKNIFLTLLTPAHLDGHWLPNGFTEQRDKDGCQVWRGKLNGVELTIISAVLGKSIREGGWDLANERPREVISLIPAGSVWFCRVESGNPADLHGHHIGKETELGRGELAVGVWK